MSEDELDHFDGYEIEKDILDTDDFQQKGTDIKINPEFYLHISLIQLTKALTKDNMQEGILQYRMLVEHMQRLAVAAKIINDDDDSEYMKECKKFCEKLDESKTTDMMKIAQFKLQRITKAVFSARTMTAPINASSHKVMTQLPEKKI